MGMRAWRDEWERRVGADETGRTEWVFGCAAGQVWLDVPSGGLGLPGFGRFRLDFIFYSGGFDWRGI
jgi:hypothetical protein